MITAEQAENFLEKKKWNDAHWHKIISQIKQLKGAPKKLGLLILNQLKEYQPSKDNDYFEYYYEGYPPRIEAIQELIAIESDDHDLWQGGYYTLLEIIVGVENAPYFKSAWRMISERGYQTDQYRRSFRSPSYPELYTSQKTHFLISLFETFEYDLSLADYAVYSGFRYNPYHKHLSLVLAAAIDEGNSEVKNTLLDLISAKHEIGMVNEVSIRALLISHDKQCWDAVEHLLLNAQREEGLRQVILEALDETSVGAMLQLLGTIIENDLSRFSSVVRALDVWIGLNWESMRSTAINRSIQFAYDFLKKPDSIPAALTNSKDYIELYMALWASAVVDVKDALAHVKTMLNNSPDDEAKRQLALFFLYQTGSTALQRQIAWPYINDENDTVLYWALKNISRLEQNEFPDDFGQLEGLLTRIPKKPVSVTFKPFDIGKQELNALTVYNLLLVLCEDQPAYWPRIASWYADISRSDIRKDFAEMIFDGYFTQERWGEDDIKPDKDIAPLSDFLQSFGSELLQDKSPEIRGIVSEALSYSEFKQADKEKYEEQLKGGNSAVRIVAQTMLEKQSPALLKDSFQTLLMASSKKQRLGALEMIKRRKGEPQWQDFISHILVQYQQQKLTDSEQDQLKDLIMVKSPQADYTLENGFGLYDPTKITAIEQPQMPISGYFVEHILDRSVSSAASKLVNLFKKSEQKSPFSQSLEQVRAHLDDLDNLIKEHADTEIICESYNGSNRAELLGASKYLPEIKNRYYQEDEDDNARLKNWQNMALHQIWEKWYQQTGMSRIDIHLIKKYFETEFCDSYSWGRGQSQSLSLIRKYPQPFADYARSITLKPFSKSVKSLKYAALAKSIIDNLGTYCLDKSCLEVDRDANQWLIASLSEKDCNKQFSTYNGYKGESKEGYWEEMPARALWEYTAGAKLDFKRFWQGYYWAYRMRRDQIKKPHFGLLCFDFFELSCEAYQQKLICHDEMYMTLLEDVSHNSNRLNFFSSESSHVKKTYKKYPFLQKQVNDFCDRIIEIELQRGDEPTDATKFAQNLAKIYGLHRFQKLITGIGKKPIRDTQYTHSDEKVPVFMSLLKVCHIHPDETQEDFNQCVKSLNLKAPRLVEIAMFAKQWQPLIASYLGWDALQSGILWLEAHATIYQQEEKEAQIGKYSNIPLESFCDGAVDVTWFKEVYASLGKKNWEILYKFAKFMGDGNGHVRAKLYADAMLANIGIREITQKIEDKRNQNYVMAYGLLGLSKTSPDNDMLNRYELLQTFLKDSKQFGAQRQRSEARSVEIAIENLARTAGYTEPLHFIWNMEAKQTRKILQQAQQVKIDDLIIDLEISAQGKAQFAVHRGDKVLKNIPAKQGKNKQVVKLKSFLKKLNLQARRARISLENAMVRGEQFPFREIEKLMQHPIVAPMLQQLVLINDENKLGFWQDAKLLDAAGESHRLKKHSQLRIAHCADLYTDGNWSQYQHYCFQHKLTQPFKQIFRELYRLSADELAQHNSSNRYAGHQVKPKQTVALLKSRGWIVDYEEGLMKVDHQQGFIGSISAMADWFTPAQTEYPTLETVQFHKRGSYKMLPLKEIPERIFSEFMRDVDLVVSVAHAGGVDPESSQSSIEMRQALVNETAQLFKFDNVRVDKNHIKIVGKLAEYSLHLGSGIIHRMPGGHIAVIPVQAQHRGRLFLPFMDDDPKSAEILSKMVMLANDHKIKDPSILEQIQDIDRK